MAAKRLPGSGVPLTINIDIKQPHAGLTLLAAMTWPLDPKRQSDALATFAIEMLAEIDARGVSYAERWTAESSRPFAAQQGASVEELMADPFVRSTLIEDAADLFTSTKTTMEEGVLKPAGGYLAGARAPGTETNMKEVRAVARSPGKHVGRAFCILASMAKFHPEIPTSLNRAWAVMEADASAKRYAIPSDRAVFMKMWKEWQPVAHIFAAYRLYMAVSVERGAPIKVGLDATATPDGLAVLLGWAAWFQAWAESFVPQRAREPLISSPAAVVIVPTVPSVLPPLEPLSAAQVLAALSYRAPTDYRT